ncbi:MAG: Anti-sigma factor antagonist [Solirubrobacterales bacterium]|nr:Anti-sigma factor antagonist [Solirubrobacterales bacterium]
MIGVELEQINKVPVARPRGDIDAANAGGVRDELAASVGTNADNLILDLSDTRYLDSAGIDMLMRLSERLRQRRARLRLVIPPSSQLLRLAELVALPDAMPVHSTLEEALAACAQEQG